MDAERPFIVKIDQLPEFDLTANSPAEVSRHVAKLIAEDPRFAQLTDDEPVQIKRPDRTPWGRNLTLGAFRNDLVDHDNPSDDGPVHPPSIEGK